MNSSHFSSVPLIILLVFANGTGWRLGLWLCIRAKNETGTDLQNKVALNSSTTIESQLRQSIVRGRLHSLCGKVPQFLLARPNGNSHEELEGFDASDCKPHVHLLYA